MKVTANGSNVQDGGVFAGRWTFLALARLRRLAICGTLRETIHITRMLGRRRMPEAAKVYGDVPDMRKIRQSS